MIILRIHEIGWVKGTADDPTDYCAHGRVEFRVNDTVSMWAID